MCWLSDGLPQRAAMRTASSSCWVASAASPSYSADTGDRGGANGASRYPCRPAARAHGSDPHHGHRVRHQLVARAFALARRHQRVPRSARTGRGLRPAGVLPTARGRRRHRCRARRARPGSHGMPTRPTRRASRSVPPRRATRCAKAAAAPKHEVQHWPLMTPAEKRAVWRRITLEAKAWRFNRYAERARTATGVDHPQSLPSRQPRSCAHDGAGSCTQPASTPAGVAARRRAEHRLAGLADADRPARGAGLCHRRHRAGRAATRPPTWRHSRSARRPTSRCSSA